VGDKTPNLEKETVCSGLMIVFAPISHLLDDGSAPVSIPLTYDKRLVDLAELDRAKGEMHGSCRCGARYGNIQLDLSSI